MNRTASHCIGLSPPEDKQFSDLVEGSMQLLLAWMETAPPILPHPNDIKAHPWFLGRLAQIDRFLPRLQLKLAYALLAVFPLQLRRMLNVHPQQTPESAGWQALGYLELFRADRQSEHLQTAERWITCLQGLRLSGYEEACWGLPFEFQSKVLFPPNLPELYYSWLSAEAFLEHYELSGNDDSLKCTLSSCHGILRIFNRLVDTQECLCLSYSPNDSMQVFNINALAGNLLMRVGTRMDEPEFVKSGRRMLQWVVNGQMPDGSWEYFSRASCPRASVIDHYHTAMVLNGLLHGLDEDQPATWVHAFKKGLRFYLDRLIDQRGRPRFSSEKTYPIDAVSGAEGMMLLCDLRDRGPLLIDPELSVLANSKLQIMAEWLCRNFQTREGPFFYQAYPVLRLRLDSYAWGQGPMLRALARLRTCLRGQSGASTQGI